MASHPDDALLAHIIDAVSEDVSAMRCCNSLQGSDGSFAVGVDARWVQRRRAKTLSDTHRSRECNKFGCVG